jgi:5-(carboxyamino)imidazole ribonucleotide synthase
MTKQRVWVLGAGQLGSMLQTAGRPLNLDVRPIAIDDPHAPAVQAGDVVTAEREQWPQSLATDTLAAHPRFINSTVFGRLADRKTQKELLDELALATAPWTFVSPGTTAASLHDRFGSKVLLKRRTGGYDGKGQFWLHQTTAEEIPADWHSQAIAEQAINFNEEVSLVGARTADGQCVFYPLTRNLHLGGILLGSIAPLPRLAQLQPMAEAMLGKLLHHLNYVGVMAMECFRVDDQLMINELAPRVHNSGHWTQAGASINQFELHLRAITALPVTQPLVKAPSVMVNLVGVERNDQWLAVPGAELIWYGKDVLPGRKVGHINITHADPAVISRSLHALAGLLPENYGAVIKWLTCELS